MMARALEKGRCVQSGQGGRKEPHGREHAEASADRGVDDEILEVFRADEFSEVAFFGIGERDNMRGPARFAEPGQRDHEL